MCTVRPHAGFLCTVQSAYDHNAGSAVVGGFVYHGSLMPQLDGKYIFGDFSNGPFRGPPADVTMVARRGPQIQ